MAPMGFWYSYHEDVVILRFSGEIPYEEEVRALLGMLADPRLLPDSRILVDRTRARMKAEPENVPEQIELVRKHQARLGRPRVAQVVSCDVDFGMLRMLELPSDSRLDHEFAVFRDLPAACAWLGIDPSLAAGD